MPAQPQTVIMLLMIAQESEAERLLATVRDGGLPVRGTQTVDPERIAELVQQSACDLIICCAHDPTVDLNAVLARHRELAADVPLIVLTDHTSEPQTVIRALSGGARDVTDRNDAERLQLVVSRELADLRARRQVRRLTQQLQQCEQRAGELVESSDEAVAFIQDGMHVHVNPAYLSLFRFPTVDDVQAAVLLDLIEAKDHAVVRDFLRDRQATPPRAPAELAVHCVRADASRFTATLTAAPAEVDGEPCLRLIVRATQSLPMAPPSEPGTGIQGGLPGYTQLIAAIEGAMGSERRPPQPFSVFYMAIRTAPNLFRDLGLTRSLAVIGTVATALTDLCGALGMLARLNDDGYGLLVLGLDETGAADLAGRIRGQIGVPQGVGGTPGAEASCEVGYVVVAGLSPNPSTLLDEAYRACQGGTPVPIKPTGAPKTTSLAGRTKQSPEDSDTAMIDTIKWGLANNRFLLVYQPIISLMDDNHENCSVLLRLIDAAENLIEAREFVGAAIRGGLIERLDKWVIRNAVKALSEHRRAGHTLNFFINLAEDSFHNPDLLTWIGDCLAEFDVQGNWFTFVIQEDLVDGNLSSLGPLIANLKTIDCRIAVNRFGATDHPQMLLQGLSLDFVLLLPEFAKGLADDHNKQERLVVLANLAREFNVKTVVTGVEDARSLTILWTAGVDYVQGNFLQRPSPTLEISN